MMKKKIKWIILIEIIVLYMSILNLISHARGPAPYKMNTEEPLLSADEMVSFPDMEGITEDGNLSIVNLTGTDGVGYAGWLSLESLEQLQVSLDVNCPDEYSGCTLIIDLYNLEEEYDAVEQEKQVVLKPGINRIDVHIEPGETHPAQAQLRIFTMNVANLTITSFSVYSLVEMERITMPMIIVPVAFAVLLMITLICKTHQQKK